ncbi:putative vacuolar protein sorting-associated protein 11-like [Apostichopus japonicus]|uniref:Vacuolar protein sorting-associated protein 11 homolog n=1 Tax=Stichopus japonicus TaxID=307972 RepID=A0A2G8JUN8_STIJA|nr:putative vacuolar protein sorting-associated protein 11-like [Apostichopus japonicus]
MIVLQWRRFTFFDKETVKRLGSDEDFTGLKDVDITACTSGHGNIVFGDTEGAIHMLSRDLDLVSFRAYELRVSHLYQLKQHNIIVSVGNDESGTNPIIKVWHLDKLDKSGNPTATRLTRALPGNGRPSPVTAMTVSENLNLMAIGFLDGSVTIYRGDVTKDRHSKPQPLFQEKSMVTGLAFRHSQYGTTLFVSTETSVISTTVTSKGCNKASDILRERGNPLVRVINIVILDGHGCSLGCSVLSDSSQDQQFVIGRSDALYFYQSDQRGSCLIFEGNKNRLQWFRNYLMVVTKDNKAIPRGIGGDGGGKVMDMVTVYDVTNKFIAYSAPVPEVISVIVEWGSLYILGGDRKLYLLREKDTQTKLETLFKKNLYVMAINLAKSQHYDSDGLIDIFTQYGDHLYSKGDHDGAIQQYIKTIGSLEPSYVIRKFLDAQRIHNLTAYLQALHKQGLANEDHTTLLLNCYTKLKDNSKLEEFIRTEEREVNFDVETAIKVCRQAGYFEHALYLSEKHRRHDWYLKIQLEDIKDFQEALSHISGLQFIEAMENMKKYGKTLMSQEPDKTTDLLKLLCTEYKPKDEPLVDMATLEGGLPPPLQRASAEEFIHIFVNNSPKLSEFLEHMIKAQPESSQLIYNTYLELCLNDMMHKQDGSRDKRDVEKKAMDLLQTGEGHYDIDLALVLCQKHNFSKGILYLYEKAKLYQQILHYHMDHDKYDNILDVCKRYGTQDPNLWVQALSYFATKQKDCKPYIVDVLSQIDRHNLLPPLLVIQTLAHNSTATLTVIKDYIVRRLQQENDQITEDERLIEQYREETKIKRAEIEEMKASAKIFQVSKCSVCSHPLELPSVHFHFNLHSAKIFQVSKCSVCSYPLELPSVHFHFNLHSAKIFQVSKCSVCSHPLELPSVHFHFNLHSAKIFQVSKCSVCSHPLELPSVHFLCQHSYHQSCFESYADNDQECPACLPENRKVLDIIKAQEQNKDLDEEFHRQLENAQDGFSVVADYFGRGVFNKVILEEKFPSRETPAPAVSQIQPLPSQVPPVQQLQRSNTPEHSSPSSSKKTPSCRTEYPSFFWSQHPTGME